MVERQHHPARAARHHRAYRLAHEEESVGVRLGVIKVHFTRHNIDPIQPLRGRVPDGPFAQLGLEVQEQFN